MNLADIQDYDKKHGTDYVKRIQDITETFTPLNFGLFQMWLTDHSLSLAIQEMRKYIRPYNTIKLREIEHDMGQARR